MKKIFGGVKNLLSFFSSQDVTIRKRLMVSVIAISVLSILIVSVVNSILVRSILSNSAWENITYEGREKSERITNYFDKLVENLNTLADSRYFQDLVVTFSYAIYSDGATGEEDMTFGPSHKRVFNMHVERLKNINKSNLMGNMLIIATKGQVLFQSDGTQLLGKNL